MKMQKKVGKKVNKRERVLAAYRGQKPDRVPCAFWYHFPAGYEYGEKAEMCIRDRSC